MWFPEISRGDALASTADRLAVWYAVQMKNCNTSPTACGWMQGHIVSSVTRTRRHVGGGGVQQHVAVTHFRPFPFQATFDYITIFCSNSFYSTTLCQSLALFEMCQGDGKQRFRNDVSSWKHCDLLAEDEKIWIWLSGLMFFFYSASNGELARVASRPFAAWYSSFVSVVGSEIVLWV